MTTESEKRDLRRSMIKFHNDEARKKNLRNFPRDFRDFHLFFPAEIWRSCRVTVRRRHRPCSFFSASLLGVEINHAADGGLRSIDNPYFFVQYHGNAAAQMMMMMIMCVLGWVTHVDVETPSRWDELSSDNKYKHSSRFCFLCFSFFLFFSGERRQRRRRIVCLSSTNGNVGKIYYLHAISILVCLMFDTHSTHIRHIRAMESWNSSKTWRLVTLWLKLNESERGERERRSSRVFMATTCESNPEVEERKNRWGRNTTHNINTATEWKHFMKINRREGRSRKSKMTNLSSFSAEHFHVVLQTDPRL